MPEGKSHGYVTKVRESLNPGLPNTTKPPALRWGFFVSKRYGKDQNERGLPAPAPPGQYEQTTLATLPKSVLLLKRHAEHHGMEVITAFDAVLALKTVLQEGGVLQLCLYEIMNHIEEADTSGHRSSGRKRPAERRLSWFALLTICRETAAAGGGIWGPT